VYFPQGYQGAAERPHSLDLVKTVLLDYGLASDDSQANSLATAIVASGRHYFSHVGGSMVQLFIHESVVEKYMFLCNGPHGILYRGSDMTRVLRSGNLTDMQARIIVDPDIFVHSNAGRIFHYPSRETSYRQSKANFRMFVQEMLGIWGTPPLQGWKERLTIVKLEPQEEKKKQRKKRVHYIDLTDE